MLKGASSPLRHGGLGLPNPQETAELAYEKSTLTTTKSTEQIYNQKVDLKYNTMDQQQSRTIKSRIQQLKDTTYSNHSDALFEELIPEASTTHKQSNGNRGIFLDLSNAHQSHWVCTNKQGFRDATCIRYGWKIDGTPTQHRVCEETNSVDHSLICKLVWIYNSARDAEAHMREICKDVKIEPTLLPITENNFERKVNTADNARLDISVRGFWNSCEKTFCDIRITYPTSVLFCKSPFSDPLTT